MIGRGLKIEIFSCSGGMSEGFRRAGVTFDLAIDFEAAHCDSHQRNLGHRPVCMDVRDLLRMARLGWSTDVDLLVADPPCTPWSRAGKRLGTEDERDMLGVTCELIALLRPEIYLIGNVPGLDDSTNWHVVQKHVGGLERNGYCVRDFVALDAADFSVPQHRIRPFWFGHRAGPCIRWPSPTHADPDVVAAQHAQSHLFGDTPLLPWVTCRQALGHLVGDELGRSVRLRKRGQNSKQHGSIGDRPARVVGTTNLSDGNVIVRNERHAPAALSGPHLALRFELQPEPPKGKRPPSTKGPQWSRIAAADAPAPAPTVLTDIDRVHGNGVKLEWPWDHDERMAPVGHHDGAMLSRPDAVLLSERAAAIIQGFPDGGCNGRHKDAPVVAVGERCNCGEIRRWHFSGETKTARWSQIGQAMPPPLAYSVATSIVAQARATGLDLTGDTATHGIEHDPGRPQATTA